MDGRNGNIFKSHDVEESILIVEIIITPMLLVVDCGLNMVGCCTLIGVNDLMECAGIVVFIIRIPVVKHMVVVRCGQDVT